MRLPLLLTLCLALVTPMANAQHAGRITGMVLSEGKPIANARVRLTPVSPTTTSSPAGVSSPIRETISTETGTFELSSLPFGTYSLRIAVLGYSIVTRTITISDTATVYVGITLVPLPTEAVIVTATRRDTYVTESPVKTEVITSQFLERNATSNLMDAVQSINGLSQQIDCGVCYTNSIRINGMGGPYTGVLIDGMPIMGALASVYGLNGINPALIDRLEIIKGPASTLYGSEAMGGVVNVITKHPRFAPRLTLDSYLSSRGERNIDLAAAPRSNTLSSLFSATYYSMPNFVDENGDNFSDVTIGHRVALFGKILHEPMTGVPRFGLTAKYYDEDRFGGVRGWTKAHRGSSTVYGESIRTRRGELLGLQTFEGALQGMTLQFSASAHHQDSYYGDTPFRATQIIGHSNLLWARKVNRSHKLLAGLTLRYNDYKDNTPAQTGTRRQIVPGFLIEDEVSASNTFTLLAGTRLDYHEVHGTIFAPRLGIKWAPSEHTTFRVNGGSGFRVVNLFTEDHAALSGTRQVVIDGALRPERSSSVSLNLNQVLEFGVNNMMIDVDAFYTRFTNKIVPNYDTDPSLIVYRNLNGQAVTRGVALSFNQNFLRVPLLYAVGMTFQDVYTDTDGIRSREFFTPRFKANLNASYTFTRANLTLDYTGVITGSMRLPKYGTPFERPTQSPTHAVHNAQATYAVRSGVKIYASVKNLLNYTQGTPLIDPQHPFGPNFDTNYVWGPVQGRYLLVGLRLSRKSLLNPPTQSVARKMFRCPC